MRPQDVTSIDRMLDEVMARASDGLDFGMATGAITDGVMAIRRQLRALAKKSYKNLDAAVVSRCVAQTTKALDDLFRLLQFAKGNPDSRPDVGSDWLRGLKKEQLDQVQLWLEQNQAEAEAKR